MKFFKRFSKLTAIALVISMFFGMNAFASSTNEHFDFEYLELNLAKGDVFKTRVYVSDSMHGGIDSEMTYSIYMVGNTSKNTYAWSDFKCGYSDVEIHIAPDETAEKITLYFYIDGLDEHDNMNIHIVEPRKSDNIETRRAAYFEAESGDTNTQK